MDVTDLLEGIRSREDYADQIVHVRELPAREARYGELRTELSNEMQLVLRELGIERLYTHQTEAVNLALAGENVVIVAATASGKTLCYSIPIAEAIYERPTSRALLLFPTKALAQDQLRKLSDFGAGTVFAAGCYDGDTPQTERRRIRRESQVILTNPDMLHLGILPYHQNWGEFIRNLRYVVLDEMHVYRGVFGSHTANVLRRLRRIAAHYGAQPQFICCSATIGNPKELAEQLIGVPIRLVDDDGAPSGTKRFVLWRPPLLKQRDGARRSPNVEAARLMAMLVRHGVRNITFTIARQVAELILRYARQELKHDDGHLAKRIASYRAGYLPKERREIERELFEGHLLGVTATSALELGIDVGSLEAAILTGYPGSIASTWQQAGRAGRTQADSLAILIGLNSAVDQYIMRTPDYLFQATSERGIADPRNRYILAGHLLCAAYELPIQSQDEALFGPQMDAILDILAEARYVVKRHTKYYWIGDGYPAAQISIRSASGEGYDIVDESHGNTLLGTADAQTGLLTVHEGAIYLHRGDSYLVKRLDLEEKVAYVRPTRARYYTSPLVTSRVEVLREADERPIPSTIAHYGELRVTEQVVGYQKRRQFGEGAVSSETLDLPPQEFETTGLWIPLAKKTARALPASGERLAGGVHGLEHCIIALLPIFALCDPHDVAGTSHEAHPDLGAAGLFIYDGYPGGMGICEAAFERLDELLKAVVDTIANCPCEDGCPSCIQSSKCGDMNSPLDKKAALRIAREWAGECTA